MNVCLRIVCPLLRLALCLVGLSVPASVVQAQTLSGTGSGLQYTAAIAAPLGSLPPPQYIPSADCWYAAYPNDPDPASQPTLSIEHGLSYQWGGSSGPVRDVLEVSGPCTWDGSKQGYHWSFDISGDAFRAFGVPHLLIHDRDNTATDTRQAAPYTLGVSVVQVVNSSGAPIPNALVKIVNSLDAASYSQGTTDATGSATFGQGTDTPAQYSYAPGMAADTYSLVVTASGYADLNQSGGTGGAWPGQTYTAHMGASSSSLSSAATSGSSGSTCSASDFTTVGTGAGIASWFDGSFPSSVTPTFLHSGPWSETVTVAVAGPYTITGDCATASNMGTVTLTVGGTAVGTVDCASASPGAKVGATFGVVNLVAGPNTLNFTMGGSYAAVKTLHMVPTSACGASSGSGGSGSFGDFFTTFWAKIQQFFSDMFTLDSADLDAIKAAASRLATYGPLGVPGGVMAELNLAFGGTYTGITGDGSDPSYWIIHLTPVDLVNATASLPAAPAGYNPGTAAAPPAHVGNIFDSMMPGQVDLLPYSSFLLIGRRVQLVAIWLLVLFGLVSRFTPSLRI